MALPLLVLIPAVCPYPEYAVSCPPPLGTSLWSWQMIEETPE
jgi:hypothetical protein